MLNPDQRADSEVKNTMYNDVDELIFDGNQQVVSSQR